MRDSGFLKNPAVRWMLLYPGLITAGVAMAVGGARWLYAQDPRVIAVAEALGAPGVALVAGGAWLAGAAVARRVRRTPGPVGMLVGDGALAEAREPRTAELVR
jgi:hypothetical protein